MSDRSITNFECPQCQAAYKVVGVEGASFTEIACKNCGDPSRDGPFMLKYFLVKRPHERKHNVR
jgi:Zn ribbon nucleic-acid-binding protein